MHVLSVGQLVAVVCPLKAATISPLELRKLAPMITICCPGCPDAGSSEVIIGSPLARARAWDDVVVEEGGVVCADGTDGGGIEPVGGVGAPLERTVGAAPWWVGADWCTGVDLAEVGFAPGPLVSTKPSTTAPIATTTASAPIDIGERGAARLTASSSEPASIGDGAPERSLGDAESLVELGGFPWFSRARSTAVSIARRPRVPGVGVDGSDP